ncbi:hypothetical protein SLA2020_369820 [Shorea laevis]
MIETQFHTHVQQIRSDSGKEFTEGLIKEFCFKKGILQQTSCVNTPQQNGVVERKHRHLLEVARALRFQANLPLSFWGECVLTATYLINLTPTPILSGLTPFEKLFNKQPCYDSLKVFGCLCYAHNHSQNRGKFDSRASKCIFVGYPLGKKGYKLYDLETQQIFTSRDVIFYEHIFPYQSKENEHHQGKSNPTVTVQPFEEHSLTNDNPHDKSEESTHQPESMDQHKPLEETQNTQRTIDSQPATDSGNQLVQSLRPQRERRAPRHLDDYVCSMSQSVDPNQVTLQSANSGTLYPLSNHLSYNSFSPNHKAYLAAITSLDEPKTFSQAVKSEHWREAMRKEITTLEQNETWTLERLPPGKQAIDSKWVYKIKYNPDGTVERYKVRLVAKGFTQIEGLDYHETFAPVAKLVTVRVLLAVASIKHWELHQLDVNNAFLQGDLHEEVFMKIPQGFLTKNEHRVCKLHKSLYGLKQASRNWFEKPTNSLQAAGFKQSYADYSLFTSTK